MPTDRWLRLEHIFTEAVERPEYARADFVDRACGADHGMRDEIRLLLTAAEGSGDFLCAPALEVFARQIVREGWIVRPGDRIASYAIERRLGAGAMGEVWRARDERLARDVAIKFLLPQASNVERVRSFEHEARAAGTLNHPNVLTVYDVGEYHDAPFLVTECLDGESLRTRLGAGRPSGRCGTGNRRPGRTWSRCRSRTRHCPSRSEAREHSHGAGRSREDPRLRPRDAP